MSMLQNVVLVYVSVVVVAMLIIAFLYEKYVGRPNVYVLIGLSLLFSKLSFGKLRKWK